MNIDKSLEIWKISSPDKALTWGKKITGDVFVELAQKYCKFTPEKSILELGPGYGRILESLLRKKIPFKDYTGVDISKNNIDMLKDHFKLGNYEFFEGSFSDINLPKKYDIVLSSLVLKHQYPTFHESLKRISKFINNSGILIFDLLENTDLGTGRNRLNEIIELGPGKTKLRFYKWQKNGPGTYIGIYTKNEVSLLMKDLPLEILHFDKVIHHPDKGERLVVVAKK